MLFVITAIDRENAVSLRLATRAAHFDYARESGAVRLGGPFLDDRGEMVGSLIIIEAQDLQGAQAWQAADPYVRAGLFAQVNVRPWKATANHCNADL